VQNILEQETKLELARLQNEFNENQNELTQKMNELREEANIADQERLEAENKICETNEEIHKMQYDDNIRHRYVYQTLLN